MNVPERYRGVVVDKKDAPKAEAPKPDGSEAIDVDAEDNIPLGTLEAKAGFDEMVVWGHESMADAVSDPYVRGVEEWIKMAEQVSVWLFSKSSVLLLTGL